jgi:hypothetical protein
MPRLSKAKAARPRGRPPKPRPEAPAIEADLKPQAAAPRNGRPYEHRPEGGKGKGPKQIHHVPSPETRKMIANMASYGLNVLTIVKLTGLSSATIYRHYGHEMQTAAAQKDLVVLQSAFLSAIGGPERNWEKADKPMQRWWIERRQPGWAPPPQRTMNINANMDLSRLSDEQLDELERILEAASPEGADDRGDSAGEIGPPIAADEGDA